MEHKSVSKRTNEIPHQGCLKPSLESPGEAILHSQACPTADSAHTPHNSSPSRAVCIPNGTTTDMKEHRFSIKYNIGYRLSYMPTQKL